MKHSPTARLTRAEASTYLAEKHDLACRPCTLAKYATHGGGPPYVVRGKWSVYLISDLDSWARSRTKPPSTKGWVAKRAEAVKAAAPRAA